MKSFSVYFKNRYAILILISMLNLFFMHYFFYFKGYIEWLWMYSGLVNICCVVFDISILLIIFILLFGRRFKLAVLITYLLSFIWAIVNVVYGEFFYQYIPLSAIGEAHALGDGLVIDSLMTAFHWYDLFWIVSLSSFFFVYRKTKDRAVKKKWLIRLFWVPIISLLTTVLSYSIYHFIHPHYRCNFELYQSRMKEFIYDTLRGGTPNLAHFQNGCFRVCAYELYDLLHVVELTEAERNEISSCYKDHSLRVTRQMPNTEIHNVVFILMESILSAPIDLIVDGKEVTPFLNSLKRDSDVYYNGNMISNIEGGESSDGQFIYMNGVLPLQYKMTVGRVKNHTLPSLPRVLNKYCGVKRSEIIYPTMPNLWQQGDMNEVYGFTEAYSIEEIAGGPNNPIDDEKIFTFAANRLESDMEPFFSLILSVSTHSPYNHFVGEDICSGDKSLPEKYRNYLNTCHYLDQQLCHYFNQLKAKGLYERCLIVLCADHYAHPNRFDMDGRVSNKTPLFIVHGNINKDEVWNGEFNQLDVYTTVLDIFGTGSEWRGFGHTLLKPTYSSSVNSESFRLSKLIIDGDYFKYVE